MGSNPIWVADFFRVDVISTFNIPYDTPFGGKFHSLQVKQITNTNIPSWE